jgi:hypothetical protein
MHQVQSQLAETQQQVLKAIAQLEASGVMNSSPDDGLSRVSPNGADKNVSTLTVPRLRQRRAKSRHASAPDDPFEEAGK